MQFLSIKNNIFTVTLMLSTRQHTTQILFGLTEGTSTYTNITPFGVSI